MSKQLLEDIFHSTGEKKQQLIEKGLREYEHLVHITINRKSSLIPDGIDKDDVTQDCRMALYRSLKSYDPTRGISFRTYAISNIVLAIISSVKSLSYSPAARTHEWEISKATKFLESQLNRKPSNLEIADYLGISETKVNFLLSRCGINSPTSGSMTKSLCPSSTCEIEDDNEQIPILDLVSSRWDETDLVESTVTGNVAVKITQSLDELPEVYGDIVRMVADGYTLTEISDIVKLSSNTVAKKYKLAKEYIKGKITLEELPSWAGNHDN